MFKGPDGQTGLGPATPTPIETTNRPAQENLANNLYHAVNAAPLLGTMPDLAWAAAHRGGDIANNAQGISTLLLAHHIGNAVASWHEQNPEWLQEFHSNLDSHAQYLQRQQQELLQSEAEVKPAKNAEEVTWSNLGGFASDIKRPINAILNVDRGIHETRAPGEVAKGLADGLFNIGRGAYKEITPSTQGPTPLTQQIDDFYHHTQLHLEHTVFSPEWWVENSRKNQAAHDLSHKYETGQLKIPTEPIAGQPQVGPQIPGQPLMPQVSGRFGTMALVEGANPNDVARGAKSFLKWVNQEFDNLQHLNRAVHLAYQKEGWAGVGRMLAPGMLAAGLTFLAPEGTPFFGEAAAASAESMVGEAGAGAAEATAEAGAGAAEATAEAGGIGARAANAFKAPSNLTAETNAEGAAAAATAPARAGETLANQTLGRAAAIPKAGMRALNTLTTSPRLLAFQLGPQMYANISSRLHLDPSYSKIWDQTIQANGMLTFGQDLSKALGMGKNSPISGAADAIVSLAEVPMMAGRAGAIEREAADRTLAANTADQVRTMFRSSPRYRRALRDIVKIVKDAPTKEQAVGDITSLYGNFARGVFSDPAIRDEVLKSATSPEELSKALEDIASLHDMKQIFQLPTMGIYGMLKQLKNSDGKIPSWFNHYFAQAPFMTSAEGRASKVLPNELVWGDAKSADMVAQLLRSKGIPASRANLVIGDLLHSASPQEFRNISANAIAAHGDGIITKRMFQEAFRNAKGEMLKGDAALFRKLTKGGEINSLGNVVSAKLTKEEIARAEAILQAVPTGKDAPLRQAYDVMRHEWNNLVKTQLGGAWGTPDAYGMRIDGSAITGGAITDAQRGFMSLPRFQDFDKMMSEFWKSNKDAFSPSASFRNAFARRALNGNAHINRWLNEMFFKPLALATPGWAMRVSVSEAALNIARQGPGNYVAGRVGNRLETNLSKIGAKGEKIASRGVQREEVGSVVDRGAWWNKPLSNSFDGKWISTPKEAHDQLVKDATELQRRKDVAAASAAKPRPLGMRKGVLQHLNQDIDRRGETDGLTYDEIDLVKDFAKQISPDFSLFDGIKISVSRKAQSPFDGRYGNYDFASKFVNLFGNAVHDAHGINRTLIHELWHHLSAFAPEGAISGLERELAKARSAFEKNNPFDKWLAERVGKNGKLPSSLKRYQKYLDDKSLKTPWGKLPQGYLTGLENYRLTNLDEWFAETMYDRTASRMASDNPLVEMAHRFISAVIAGVGKVFNRATGERVFRDFWNNRVDGLSSDFRPLQNRAIGNNVFGNRVSREITGEDVANMLGKDGYKVDMKTREAIALFMRGFRVGFDRALLKGLDKEYVANAAVRLAYRHGAYLPDSVDARHGHIGATDVDMPSTMSSKDVNIITEKKNFGDSFGARSQGTEGHIKGWEHGALTYSTAPIVGRPMAQAYKELYDSGLRGVELHDAAVEKATSIINGLDPREATQFDRFHNIDPKHDAEKGSLNPKADAVASWAENLVSGLEGVVGSQSGFVNERLLNDIANDQVVTGVQNFGGTYGVDKDGKKLGTLQIPDSTAFRDVTFKQGKNGPFAAFTSAMHNKMLGPMVNNLVRKPVYIVEFATERKALESQVAKGILTADQADVLAETYAAQNMVRFIHNPADKTHFEEMMRTAAPFYFAQNQAFRRMGRLFSTNPGAFLQYMDAMMGVVNWTNNVTSQNGIGLLNIPSIAMWGIGWTASISSLQSMDPLAAGEGAPNGISPVNVLTDALTPKFGPAITIPTILLNAVAPSLQDNKATAKATRFIEGPITGTENVTQQLGGVIMPNSLVRNVTGMILGSGAFGLMKPQDILGYSNTYNQAKIEAFKSIVTPASEQYWNSLPKNMPQDKKIGELTQWVANRFFKNGAGPGSLQDTWDRANNRAMLIYSTKLALGAGSPVSIGVGRYQKNKFDDIVHAEAKKNGGDYLKGLEAAERDYPYFFAGFVSSSQSSTGQYVPQTKAIGDFITTHHSLVADHPYGALAYGPSNIFDAGKFDETTHQKLVAAGLRTQDTPDAFAKATQIMLGNITYYNTIKPLYEQYRQGSKSAAYKWKTQVETAYGVLNDPWWQHFNPHESYMNAMRGVSDIQAIMQMPEYRNDPRNAVYQNIMTKGIPILMQYKAEISSGKYSAQSVSNWWNGVMDQVVQNYPDAKAGIDGIFRSLG